MCIKEKPMNKKILLLSMALIGNHLIATQAETTLSTGNAKTEAKYLTKEQVLDKVTKLAAVSTTISSVLLVCAPKKHRNMFLRSTIASMVVMGLSLAAEYMGSK